MARSLVLLISPTVLARPAVQSDPATGTMEECSRQAPPLSTTALMRFAISWVKGFETWLLAPTPNNAGNQFWMRKARAGLPTTDLSASCIWTHPCLLAACEHCYYKHCTRLRWPVLPTTPIIETTHGAACNAPPTFLLQPRSAPNKKRSESSTALNMSTTLCRAPQAMAAPIRRTIHIYCVGYMLSK